MRLVVATEHSNVLLLGNATVKHGSLHFRQVLLEAIEFVADLERKFASVAQNERLNTRVLAASLDVELLKNRKNKDSSLQEQNKKSKKMRTR